MNQLPEIESLVESSGKDPRTLFYVGLVMGLVMGPAVLVAAAIPSVRDALVASENDPGLMVVFGAGMTLLLGVATVEQWGKARKAQKLRAEVAENPHRITSIQKGSTDDGVTRLAFQLRDGAWAQLWLEEADAQRLISLLETTPFVFCPYCITPIDEDATLCPRCEQDVTRDAPFEMYLADYRAEKKKSCRHCGAPMAQLAIRCAQCGERQ